ncbi:MAG: pyridoxal 5'-phosphate synthase glutaminase subunit PdxT [Lachnospiraceae bacterium]|nr:pyridoxal 5'-phosphate synthase glutaminase subunit PdxT [Lachnospiraceae bacterium]
MKIAVLAVQGAFMEHEKMLAQLGIESLEIRQRKDLGQDFDGLILPGGESTVMGKLLRELDLLEPLKAKIADGLPVLGTCAGLILLAEKLSNDDNVYFGTLPVTVKRNAYGRQLGSFFTNAKVKGVGEIPMAFIRAPYIEAVGSGAEVIAEVDGNIVGVRYGSQIGISFHPEVTDSLRFHKYFADLVTAFLQ